MKVMHFSSAKSWRGGEQQIAYLLYELRENAVEQWVICVEGSPLADYCQTHNFPYFTYNKRSSIDPRPARLMARTIQREQIELVHIHDAHAHTFACLAVSFFGAKVPLVLSRRVDFPIRKNAVSRWKYNHPAIKAILCVSHFIQEVITPAIKRPEIIRVVYSGIDLSRFTYERNTKLRSAFSIAADSPLIVNVAAIAPHKDYFTFVDTAKRLLEVRPQARFLIIGGDGGQADAVRQHVQRLQLSEYIQFTGFRDDIPEILPGADVFLFTSKEEGLGTSVLDALACKVPVVATRAGGVTEIIEDEVNGLLAPVQNPEQLARQVLRLLDDTKLRKELAEAGLSRISTFTKAETARKTLAEYWRILRHDP